MLTEAAFIAIFAAVTLKLVKAVLLPTKPLNVVVCPSKMVRFETPSTVDVNVIPDPPMYTEDAARLTAPL